MKNQKGLKVCQEMAQNFDNDTTKLDSGKKYVPEKEDPIAISKKHHPNFILCDLDGDKLSDSVQIVLNKMNKKYGLKIIFGNNKIEYLGLGKDDFDDMSWVDIIEKAPKGKVYFNNLNEEGDFISEDEVKESDKIKLQNDGIFIHQAEACGGAVIYFNKGKFEWIDQE